MPLVQKPKQMVRLPRIAFGAILLFVLFVVASWVTGSILVASTNHAIGPPPKGWDFRSTVLESRSGSQVATWYGGPVAPKGVVVLVHSLRGDRLSMLSRAKLCHEAGFATVLIDLQGHGESPGKSITFGFLECHDVEAAVKFARTQYPGQKIAVLGVSLGGAAALLASPLNIDALVLESVYPTIDEAVHDRISKRMGPLSHAIAPVLLCQLWPRLGISTRDLRPIDQIAQAGCPVLVAAGDADDHTTLAETNRIFETASEPKEKVIFEGAGHVDLLNYDPKLYKRRVMGFLGKYVGKF